MRLDVHLQNQHSHLNNQWLKPNKIALSLQWRHNGLDSVSNHQLYDCLLNRLFGRRSKKTSKLRVTGLCAGNSPGTGEFPAQMASNAENLSIWWRHHEPNVHQIHDTPNVHQMYDMWVKRKPLGPKTPATGYLAPPKWWKLSWFSLMLNRFLKLKF